MSLKTRPMLNIFQPIESQIKKLKGLLENNNDSDYTKIDSIRKVFIDQLQLLGDKFKNASQESVENYNEMKFKITSVIEEFCIIQFDKVTCSGSGIDSEKVLDELVVKFITSLEILEELQVKPLKQNIAECMEYIKDMGSANAIEDFENIRELGCSIIDILENIQIYKKMLVSDFLQERLGLYCRQVYSSFTLLVKVVQTQHEEKLSIIACKKYTCDRLYSCLESINILLTNQNRIPEEELLEEENNFVSRVDFVLDIINNLNEKRIEEQIQICQDLWEYIEDVFAHAMAIAQVSEPYNFKAISGSCHSIMLEYEQLITQLKTVPQDRSMNILYMNSLTDAMYRLERKINISVLTLVMEVFSNPFIALKNLIKLCGNNLALKEKVQADLDKPVEEFDQLSDKCIQIGKFAISCCRNKNRMENIKNCLASFETLEMELIPAIIAFYLNPEDIDRKVCVKLLTFEWQKEMNEFQTAVELIIDPAAYCQVVLDDLQDKTNEMMSCLDDKESISLEQVKIVTIRALSLHKQINTTICDIGQENIDEQICITLREFKAAIFEIDAAAKKFLKSQNASAPTQSKVITRCEIMLKVIKRLFPTLSNIINESISDDSVYEKSVSKQVDLNQKSIRNSSLHFPSSINGLPWDQKSSIHIKTPFPVKCCKPQLCLQPPDCKSCAEKNLSALIPYIQRGRLLRTEWSIMYKTPKRNADSVKAVKNKLKFQNVSNVRQHLFSRDTFTEEHDEICNESIDLTNILGKLTSFSKTNTEYTKRNTCFRSSLKPFKSNYQESINILNFSSNLSHRNKDSLNNGNINPSVQRTTGIKSEIDIIDVQMPEYKNVGLFQRFI